VARIGRASHLEPDRGVESDLIKTGPIVVRGGSPWSGLRVHALDLLQTIRYQGSGMSAQRSASWGPLPSELAPPAQ
jgi:hypothetical protein